MKILVVSDVASKRYYQFYKDGSLDEFDLILSCGDLPREYLEFLVTMSHCPLLYVHGNHDDKYDMRSPEGCICIDGKIYEYKGIRILGLGGSYRYNDKGKYMYVETEMKTRAKRLWFKLFRKKGFDILLTHAPARGINDEDNFSHRGFEVFNSLIKKYKPKYFIHGHIHMNYGINIPRECKVGDTTVVNGYEDYTIIL